MVKSTFFRFIYDRQRLGNEWSSERVNGCNIFNGYKGNWLKISCLCDNESRAYTRNVFFSVDQLFPMNIHVSTPIDCPILGTFCIIFFVIVVKID